MALLCSSVFVVSSDITMGWPKNKKQTNNSYQIGSLAFEGTVDCHGTTTSSLGVIFGLSMAVRATNN